MDRRFALILVTLLPACAVAVTPETPKAPTATVAAVRTVAGPAAGSTAWMPAPVQIPDTPGTDADGPRANELDVQGQNGAGLDPLPEGLAWGADSTPRAVLRLDPYVARLRTVSVAVGDAWLPFLFDTGGGVTMLTPEAAGAVACDPFGRMVGLRHDGTPVAIQRCPPLSLRMDGWSTSPREVGVYDLMGLLPDGLPTLGGLLALDTFDDRAITLVLGADSLVVESRGSLARRIEEGTEIRMREAHQASGASLDVFLAAEAEPGRLWFELDSGNTGPVLLAPHAAEALGVELSATEPRPVTLELAGYGPVTVQAVVKENLVYDGLLNAAFLETVTLTLDLLEERAWIGR